ncbi:MAG: DUF6528 family protein [Planctomycetaceae bacterium]
MFLRRVCWGLLLLAMCRGVVCADELILAGGDEVFILDAGEAEAGRVKRLWRWSGQEAVDIPEEVRKQFHHMDECKVVAGGRRVLVCASNGGCAVLERVTGKVLWRATSRNAHSLDLLPGDRVVVASSLGGDHLEVFATGVPAAPVIRVPLHSAHGVLWDESRRCLWALGFDELRRYHLVDWSSDKPALELSRSWRLPDDDGHDLRAVPGSGELLLTTGVSVLLFDRDSGLFRVHPELGSESKVKSADVHPVSGRLVISRWSSRVQLLGPGGAIQFTDAQPYKVRWVD